MDSSHDEKEERNVYVHLWPQPQPQPSGHGDIGRESDVPAPPTKPRPSDLPPGRTRQSLMLPSRSSPASATADSFDNADASRRHTLPLPVMYVPHRVSIHAPAPSETIVEVTEMPELDSPKGGKAGSANVNRRASYSHVPQLQRVIEQGVDLGQAASALVAGLVCIITQAVAYSDLRGTAGSDYTLQCIAGVTIGCGVFVFVTIFLQRNRALSKFVLLVGLLAIVALSVGFLLACSVASGGSFNTQSVACVVSNLVISGIVAFCYLVKFFV